MHHSYNLTNNYGNVDNFCYQKISHVVTIVKVNTIINTHGILRNSLLG